ncbi:MAG: hypothetical protein Q8Q08_10900 [Candidatus Omnitrophota bacterium]|nr:hypothetical protein [Candidatus Omnitrophota bacterium]
MKKIFFSVFTTALILLAASPRPAVALNENSIAYKLAVLEARAQNPEKVLMRQRIKPADAAVMEFQWILDNMKSRCLNPESAIADTIVETWQVLTQKEQKISLLQTARELSSYAQNTRLFGTGKVNFRMTSRYWLQEKLKTIKTKG